MKKTLLIVLMAAAAVPAYPLTAAFSSDEADRQVYVNGFDSESDLEGWTLDPAWSLTENVSIYGADVKPFSSVDPASKLSAGCDVWKVTKAAMTSPLIEVPAGASLKFYAAFSEIWGVYGHLEVTVIDGTDRKLLLNSFLWSQEDGNDGDRWVSFKYDISAYAGRKVQFEFCYVDAGGGENVYVDGLAITVPDTSADSSVTISEGQSVTFADLSDGATEWHWTFAGGTPAESNEKNPTVTYAVGGDYDVTLTVGDGSGATATAERKAYVHVRKEQAKALIGRPEGTYYSPWAMYYVPVGTPVTYRDLSSGNPTEWLWTLPGTEEGTCTEQHATVTYKEEGLFGIKLHAANEAGGTDDEYVDAVQAGGAQYVWNITPQENPDIDVIALGWYGNYAGSNYLGMDRFAEHFEGPAAAATVDGVQAYFGKATVVPASAEYPVTVSIALPAADGTPGEIVATASLKASELVDGSDDYSPTTFTFASPVAIAKGQDFFVVIGPFPTNENPDDYSTDDIALYCSPRVDDPSEREATMWHFLLDENPDYTFAETGHWIKQSDDPGSIAITPHLTFERKQDSIVDIFHDASEPVRVVREGDNLVADGPITVYTVGGVIVARGEGRVGIASLEPGVYIVRTAAGACRIVR